jgi:hypothetical protein
MTGITLHPSWLVLAAAMLSGPASEPPVWWQFVMNGPNAERQVSPHYRSEQECNAALKATESWMAKRFPDRYPLVGSCEAYVKPRS